MWGCSHCHILLLRMQITYFVRWFFKLTFSEGNSYSKPVWWSWLQYNCLFAIIWYGTHTHTVTLLYVFRADLFRLEQLFLRVVQIDFLFTHFFTSDGVFHQHWPFLALCRVLTGIRVANNINMSTDHYLQTVSRPDLKPLQKPPKEKSC